MSRAGSRTLLVLALVLSLVTCSVEHTTEKIDPVAAAQELARHGDIGAAIRQLIKVIREQPKNAELRVMLARLYLEKGDPAAAESSLGRAVDLGIPKQEVLPDIIRAMLAQKKYNQILASAPPNGDGPPAARQIAVLILRGKAMLALPLYDKESTMRAYLRVFKQIRTLESRGVDRAEIARLSGMLDELRADHDAVEAAFQHHRCGRGDETTSNEPAARRSESENIVDERRIIRVGPNREFRTPSQVAAVAKDGDVIEIDNGVYQGDVAVWRQNDLVLRGIGGRVHLKANGASAENKGTWVLKGNNTVVENIEFSGARSSDRNGSGIRLLASGLTVRNCLFHHNEDGILTKGFPDSDILVEHSEFAHNGFGDGLSHNMYIGRDRSFTLQFSYSHHARTGHQVKSRARTNYILYNRLMDEEDGSSSYVIDMPDGGIAFVIGNILQQGSSPENPTVLAYAAESTIHPDHGLYVVNNTFYNKYLNGIFINNYSNTEARVINNIFAGAPAAMLKGSGSTVGSLTRPDHGMVDVRRYDYRLTPFSPAIDAGVEPGLVGSYDLRPTFENAYPARERERKRVSRIDIGAHEFCGW